MEVMIGLSIFDVVVLLAEGKKRMTFYHPLARQAKNGTQPPDWPELFRKLRATPLETLTLTKPYSTNSN